MSEDRPRGVYLNLVEGRLWVPDVEGSNPFTPTIPLRGADPPPSALGSEFPKPHPTVRLRSGDSHLVVGGAEAASPLLPRRGGRVSPFVASCLGRGVGTSLRLCVGLAHRFACALGWHIASLVRWAGTSLRLCVGLAHCFAFAGVGPVGRYSCEKGAN